ncbi:metal-dependent hydrolase [Oceanibacterium hippocampi]|uniref:Inner membrane protein n=1 Tax=Oceanibacterium hippocampi TaxID=745714 RepID=A0A1Y5SJD8_9PROT|nr:metal-dependent hydrolase [Oceanibacterium hippocampi]SLN39218.1 hypothetical protein OCH7691_01634 [Oceanibacterium hippocampi]
MDSLTQFVLGAGVAVACLGPKTGARKAALIGGVLGTLPDLDVLYPFADPVASFTLHRSATHSLLVQALATPVVAEPLVRLFDGLKGERSRTWIAVYLVFATHALLDGLTIYGTRLLWPLVETPFGLGSVFIIDPLYTLPLLVVTVWALFVGGWTPRLARAVTAALVLSTAYQGWAIVEQRLVTERARTALDAHGVTPERLMATAMPFNTLLWRAIAIDGDRYYNLYLPVFGNAPPALHAHRRLPPGGTCIERLPAAATLAAFAHGFYRVDLEGRYLVLSDLRMGLTPAYVFRFAVAEVGGSGAAVEIPPVRMPQTERAAAGDWEWLAAGIAGDIRPRPGEDGAVGAATRIAQAPETAPQGC